MAETVLMRNFGRADSHTLAAYRAQGGYAAWDKARQMEDGRLRIVVADDGSGISAKETRGFGLAGMRERVASLDGELRIADREGGKGVTLTVEIPLPAARKSGTDSPQGLTTSAA